MSVQSCRVRPTACSCSWYIGSQTRRTTMCILAGSHRSFRGIQRMYTELQHAASQTTQSTIHHGNLNSGLSCQVIFRETVHYPETSVPPINPQGAITWQTVYVDPYKALDELVTCTLLEIFYSPHIIFNFPHQYTNMDKI